MPRFRLVMAGIALYVAMSLLYLALGSTPSRALALPAQKPDCEYYWNPRASGQRDPHQGSTEAWLRQVTCEARHAWQRLWN